MYIHVWFWSQERGLQLQLNAMERCYEWEIMITTIIPEAGFDVLDYPI